MDAHGVMTVVACAGDLAFGALAFLRRSKSPLAGLIALLFLDAFTWNFATLAYELSGRDYWHSVDRLFSSLMPALALHVVVAFIGRARRMRPVWVTGYVIFGTVGLLVHGDTWWKCLAALGPAAMLLAVTLLVRHRRQSADASERARTELVMLAFLLGTFSLTDLWYQEVSFPLPRLGAIGTLVAMILFATAALRLKLLGAEVPPIVALYAFLFGLLWVVLELTLVRYLDPGSSHWVLAVGVLALIAVASAREIGRMTAMGRARTRELATLGRFAEQFAHDIRNPLAAVKGAVQFLSEEHRLGRSLDDQAAFLTLIEQQLERVERSVDRYQRIGKLEPRLTRQSLNAVVARVTKLQGHAVTSAVSLTAILPPELPEAPLDADLVETALENLVRNACEAMPKGGAITLATDYDRNREWVTVTVADEGDGMDARELEQATTLFFTTKAQGSGLGLSFAERVAKAHGGALALSSVAGRGTRVTLSFDAGRTENA
jgi:two-component system sensor histidine kinase HydH